MKRFCLCELLIASCLVLACGGDNSPTTPAGGGPPSGSVREQTFANPAGPVSGDLLVSDLPGGTTMDFVWIEPGRFVMGSPSSEPDRTSYDAPQHTVTISEGFYLGQCEITQGQWGAVMETRPWSHQDHVEENPAHPAVYVSWDDMQGFLERLNGASGEGLYRLPTEAEWEYACRAGTTTRWSFGDDESMLGEFAWYRDNAWIVGLLNAQPVGAKLANPWGLFDMHGNVWEWVQDWYGPNMNSSQIDPTGPPTGSARVLRGGYFRLDSGATRSASRRQLLPWLCGYDVGARLVRKAGL